MKFAGDFLPSQTIVQNDKTEKVFSQEGGVIARWRGTEEQLFEEQKRNKFDQERETRKNSQRMLTRLRKREKVKQFWIFLSYLLFKSWNKSKVFSVRVINTCMLT